MVWFNKTLLYIYIYIYIYVYYIDDKGIIDQNLGSENVLHHSSVVAVAYVIV